MCEITRCQWIMGPQTVTHCSQLVPLDYTGRCSDTYFRTDYKSGTHTCGGVNNTDLVTIFATYQANAAAGAMC